MRILIIGAGGVGGYYGACLLAAGRDVTFLVRPKRAQQLAVNGLRLTAPDGDLTLPPPPTVTADKLVETFDLILLSCKSYDLQSAMADLAPAVGPETAILPLLNGMAHMDTLDARFGRHNVLGGNTTVSASVETDGRILHLNKLKAIQFGDRDDPNSARIHRIDQTLTAPGIISDLRPNILYDMWGKWIAISTAAGSTCLLRANVGEIVAAGCTSFIRQIMAEAVSIATAEGFPPTQLYLDTLLAKFTEPGSHFTTSMHRDIKAGRPIEGHQIIGDLLAHARRRSLSTPLLEIVNAHLLCYEARRNRESIPAPV